MAYNTGNPIGSIDARDLYDNAQNMDKAVNQTIARWSDRFGVSRPSWAGMSHYNNVGEYAADILITGYNEVFRYDGEFYRAAADTTLPYTTTGSWSEDGPLFVPVGDAVLRHDMAYEADLYIGYYRNAINCNQYGGLEAAVADSDTLGKTIIVTDTQDVSIPLDFTGRDLAVEYGGKITLSGTGAITELKESRPEWFGAAGDWDGSTGTDDTVAIQAAVYASRNVRFYRKGYKVIDEILLNPTTMGGTGGWDIRGDGNANSQTLGTYLYQATAGKAIFKFGDVSGLVYDQQSHISNIGFTGVSTAIGIWLALAEDTTVEYCKFSSLARGIQLAIDANTQVVKPRFYNNRFQSLDYGIIGVGTRTADVWIKDNTFINNRLKDINISGEADGGWISNNFFGQDDTSVTPLSSAIYLQSPAWFRITGNQVFNTALHGIELTSPRYTTIMDNVFYRTSQQNRAKIGLAITNQSSGIIGGYNNIQSNLFVETYGQALNIASKASRNDIISENRFLGTGYLLTGAARIYDAIVVNDLSAAKIINNNINGAQQDVYPTVTTTAGSTTATLVSQVGGTLATGMALSGKGIPVNTTVTVSGSTLTLSNAATLSVTSQPMTAGIITTRYGISATGTTDTEISNNIQDNCVNTYSYMSGNIGLKLSGNTTTKTYSANATVSPDDDIVYVTATENWLLVLQSPVFFKDKEVLIVKTDDNAFVITVSGGGGAYTINGESGYGGLSAQYKFVKVKSDGAQWLIIGSN